MKALSVSLNFAGYRSYKPTRENLQKVDVEIDRLIKRETLRQKETINLIPSENYASYAVLKATGSVLANKYS